MNWISVKDQLPSKSGIAPICPVENPRPVNNWVIVATSLGKVQLSQYSSMGWCNIRFGKEEVTHWMPLPLPPTPPVGIKENKSEGRG